MIELDDIPDMHAISDGQAEALCSQLRARILETVSKTGGHLASNL